MYKLIRLVVYLLEMGCDKKMIQAALVATMSEEVEDRAMRIMHYAREGYRRTTTIPSREENAIRKATNPSKRITQN